MRNARFKLMAALVAAIFTAMAMPVAFGKIYAQGDLGSYYIPLRYFYAALPGHRQRLRLVPEPVLRLLRVRPLNPAPLAGTVPPVAPRTADLVASSRRVA